MRILIDTDVILDHLLERPEFADAATAIWNASQEGKFEGYISAITPANVYYIARRLKGGEIAREIVEELLWNWRTCEVNEQVLQSAFLSPMSDFEDAIQVESAKLQRLDGVVTRNVSDYARAGLEVMLPGDFLLRLSNNE